MPLDILINDGSDKDFKSLPLVIEDYDSIMEKVEGSFDFPIVKKNLSDYYGEIEVYLNELNDLKSEVLELKKLFRTSNSDTTTIFLNKFFKLIEKAIKQRKTIKLIGD